MPKFSINLLPPEVVNLEKNKSRLTFLNQISIGILGIFVILTASLLLMRLLQKQDQIKAQQELDDITKQVESLKNQEGLLLNLQQRLAKINSLANTKSIQLVGFDLINSLRPPNLKTTYIAIDKLGRLSYSGESSSTAQLQNFFTNLTDDKQTENRLSKARVESLNRSSSEKYHFDISATIK